MVDVKIYKAHSKGSLMHLRVIDDLKYAEYCSNNKGEGPNIDGICMRELCLIWLLVLIEHLYLSG